MKEVAIDPKFEFDLGDRTLTIYDRETAQLLDQAFKKAQRYDLLQSLSPPHWETLAYADSYMFRDNYLDKILEERKEGCDVRMFSSRICQRGTHGCVKDHGE